MSPVDRIETFLSNAAGHGDELPEPITRKEIYFKEICERIAAGVTPEQIQAAIEDYINTHGSDIVSETELSQALSGYATTAALASKADSADIPDVSGFATTAALAEKQDALTFDSAPTQNSTNPVTSGGVYTALANVGSPTDAQVQTAVDEYLNEHGINQLEAATMQEFLEAINS